MHCTFRTVTQLLAGGGFCRPFRRVVLVAAEMWWGGATAVLAGYADSDSDRSASQVFG